jgi:hypothetical protein
MYPFQYPPKLPPVVYLAPIIAIVAAVIVALVVFVAFPPPFMYAARLVVDSNTPLNTLHTPVLTPPAV